MSEFFIKNLEDWDTLAKKIALRLRPGTIITLSGPLGAGKTTFVQALARVLGSRQTPKSPTFSLVRVHRLVPKSGSTPSTPTRIVHVDAYRIEKSEDILPLGLDEALAEPGAILCIEWPEHLASWLAGHADRKINLVIILEKDGMRRVLVKMSNAPGRSSSAGAS